LQYASICFLFAWTRAKGEGRTCHDYISLEDRGPPHTTVLFAWLRSLKDAAVSGELAVIEDADGWNWLEDGSVELSCGIAA